ncbi:hypothetical protein ACP70R_039884 [Stipagrostis hirtigluma subsp. patula]
MFLEALQGEAMGEAGQVAPAVAEEQLELEAAEQLIQLSGGGDGDGESETRSADSVKCCRREKDKEVAVESRRRRRAERVPAGKDGAEDADGVLDDGEARKRPRFRWLADIYRETKKKRAAGDEGDRKVEAKKKAADELGDPRGGRGHGEQQEEKIGARIGGVHTRT